MDRRARLALISFTLALTVLGTVAWMIARTRPRSGPTVVFSTTVGDVTLLLEQRKLEGAPPVRQSEVFSLDREPIDEPTARVLFAQIGKRMAYDPLAYYRPGRERGKRRDWPEHPDGGWVVNTNSLGMRGKAEVSEARPDRRVLVVGDSHSFGLCADEETFAHLLEVRLRRASGEKTVEVLNASAGGYDPFNYLGVVERFAELRPQVVIIAFYGGNDFLGVMPLERYFHRRGAPAARSLSDERLAQIGESATYAVAQEVGQVLYFRANPEDEPIAVATSTAIATDAREVCRSMGAKLLCVYLPPPGMGQPEPDLARLAPALREFELTAEELGVSDRLADAWLAALREHDVAQLDLRPLFRRARKPCYWQHDLHLAVEGHRLVASALAPIVLGMLE